MAIYVTKAPSAGEDLVRRHLKVRRGCLEHLRWLDGELPLGSVHYVYTATREDLLCGRLLKGARPTAWLYVVGSDRQPQGLVEMSCADRHGPAPMRYASLHPCGVAKALMRAIAKAEAMVDTGYEGDEHYELRILRAPSLSLFAVWLHGDEEMLIPVRGPSAVMRRLGGRRYMRGAEIEQLLLPLARQRSVASDRG